jgi:hypothetical protein
MQLIAVADDILDLIEDSYDDGLDLIGSVLPTELLLKPFGKVLLSNNAPLG